ncbi:MAG: NADH-quinone oxidoreductase subunit J [Candidatus Omnitrophica bacterium]|nr:NADH-quinone oxidoreductase subunit J [Candidatus Omnitrophota bacterium]
MLEPILFYTFAAIAVLSALLVVLGRQPMYSVLALIITLFCLAGLFVLLQAYFLAAIQIVVYAGAVLVLFLFVIMLLNLDQAEGPKAQITGIKFAGLITAGLFLAATVQIVARVPVFTATPTSGSTAEIAFLLFTKYLVPFELISVLLLIAIIGAVKLTGRGPSELPPSSLQEGRKS